MLVGLSPGGRRLVLDVFLIEDRDGRRHVRQWRIRLSRAEHRHRAELDRILAVKRKALDDDEVAFGKAPRKAGPIQQLAQGNLGGQGAGHRRT